MISRLKGRSSKHSASRAALVQRSDKSKSNSKNNLQLVSPALQWALNSENGESDTSSQQDKEAHMSTHTTFSGNWSVNKDQDMASVVHRGVRGTLCISVKDGQRVEVRSHSDETVHMGNVFPGTSAIFPVQDYEMIVIATVPPGEKSSGQFDFIPRG